MLLVVSQLFLLFALESAHTFEHLVPINQGSVELWSIDADELCLASDGESACTTHTCTVNHDGIERYLARDVVLLSCKVRELHHDWRANGEYLIHVWLLFDKLLDTNGYYTFLAVAKHSVASSLQCLDDGQHRCDTQSTTSTYYGAVVLNLGGIAKRTNHIRHVVAYVQGTEFLRRESNHLDYQCDGAFVDVGSGNGKWHALTFLANTHYHKVASLAALGDQWSFNLEEENLLRELLLSNDFVHDNSSSSVLPSMLITRL